jgi:hypothetical protein
MAWWVDKHKGLPILELFEGRCFSNKQQPKNYRAKPLAASGSSLVGFTAFCADHRGV